VVFTVLCKKILDEISLKIKILIQPFFTQIYWRLTLFEGRIFFSEALQKDKNTLAYKFFI
jgi:hypothetical protein